MESIKEAERLRKQLSEQKQKSKYLANKLQEEENRNDRTESKQADEAALALLKSVAKQTKDNATSSKKRASPKSNTNNKSKKTKPATATSQVKPFFDCLMYFFW